MLSELPGGLPYPLAVSTKLPPTSKKRSTIARDVAASASRPKVMVPRHNSETRIPVDPNWRYSMPRRVGVIYASCQE
jgi:hypothetical protein